MVSFRIQIEKKGFFLYGKSNRFSLFLIIVFHVVKKLMCITASESAHIHKNYISLISDFIELIECVFSVSKKR